MTRRTFTTLKDIVLASASPRRRQFLSDMGIAFRIRPSVAPESLPLPGEAPEAYVMRAASAKVAEVAAHETNAVVIGADTIVVLDGAILGKPASPEHSLDMLRRLSGAAHTVFTACVAHIPDAPAESTVAASRVVMGRYDDALLNAYLRTGEPADKAGSYAVQGLGAFLIEEIQGSWTSVVGLPVSYLVRILLKHGCIAPNPGDTP